MTQALDGLARLTDLEDADVVLAIWWAPIAAMEAAQLHGKRVFCFMQGNPIRFLGTSAHRKLFGRVSLWAVRSRGADDTMRSFGWPAVYMPYVANPDEFRVVSAEEPALQSMAAQLGPRNGHYLVANFARDSEGQDLSKPKLVKGPDLFAEIMKHAVDRGLPVKAILAGPRRHWLRRTLQEFGVPFAYVGEAVECDDIDRNILPRESLNLLYNLVDLNICSSRSEGGPLAVCEAPLAGCRMISTPVGMAPDVLSGDAIFRDMQGAVEMIAADIERNALASALRSTQDRLVQNNSMEAARRAMERALQKLMDCPPWQAEKASVPSYRSSKLILRGKRLLRRVSGSLVGFRANARPKRVALADGVVANGSLFSGNVVRSLVESAGHAVENDLAAVKSDALVLDALKDWPFTMPLDQRTRLFALVNPTEDPVDLKRLIANLTALYSRANFSATLLPAPSMLSRLAMQGHIVKLPVLIPPAVDQTLFHPRRLPADAAEPEDEGEEPPVVLLGPTVTSRDMDGVRQALPDSALQIWTALCRGASASDRQIDFSDPRSRAEALRWCNVYVELQNDAMAIRRLREALSCAVPVAYLDSADSRRIVGFGGHSFDGPATLMSAIDRVLMHYEAYRRLAVLGTDDVSIWRDILGTATDV